MKEKILALLTNQFAGVRKDGLNQLARILALQATTDEEAKALVDKLTKEQVDDFVKEFRAEVDKEVSEGNKTFEMNLKKKFDLTEKKTTTEPPTKQTGDETDIASLIKSAIAEAVAPLQSKLEGYEKVEIAKSRLQTLTEKLNDCKDENLKVTTLKDFQRMQFNSDESFNEYLRDKEAAIATANQNMSDIALGGQGKPFFSQKAEDGISKGVADYIASQKTGGKELTGKEV